MRSIFYSLLSLATIATTLAIESQPKEPKEPKAKKPAVSTDDWDDTEKVPDTIFNGQTVPPMTELGTNLETEIDHGNW